MKYMRMLTIVGAFLTFATLIEASKPPEGFQGLESEYWRSVGTIDDHQDLRAFIRERIGDYTAARSGGGQRVGPYESGYTLFLMPDPNYPQAPNFLQLTPAQFKGLQQGNTIQLSAHQRVRAFIFFQAMLMREMQSGSLMIAPGTWNPYIPALLLTYYTIFDPALTRTTKNYTHWKDVHPTTVQSRWFTKMYVDNMRRVGKLIQEPPIFEAPGAAVGRVRPNPAARVVRRGQAPTPQPVAPQAQQAAAQQRARALEIERARQQLGAIEGNLQAQFANIENSAARAWRESVQKSVAQMVPVLKQYIDLAHRLGSRGPAIQWIRGTVGRINNPAVRSAVSARVFGKGR